MIKNNLKFDITQVLEISNDIYQIKGKVLDNEFTFIPGQYIVVKNSFGQKKVNRAYSISSIPSMLPEIELTVRRYSGGVMSEYLTSLSGGDSIYFDGPSGEFNVAKIVGKYVCLIAIGCGIAPLKAMADYILVDRNDIKLDLFLGAKTSNDLPYHDYWLDKQQKYNRFKYFPCLSQSTESGFYNGRVGKVMKEIQYNFAKKEYFLSGNIEMVMQMKEMIEKETDNSKIYLENVFPVKKIHQIDYK